ncbi:uncharacterized protein, partial [Temnothorax nylanderi]|uniref:uncharacterized protein n=1 Tax=Temnothorax nylanderi TaxID=102681 RepID=UPI003A88485C
MRRPFPPELRLAVTLGYLAHADSVWSKKWSFRIGRSTVYKIIPETCNAIIIALQPIYLPPMTREDWRNVADGFYDKWNFPNCIGALDGKHIRIQAPKNSGSQFFNYKKFFSIVLMAICDANYVFKWVDIGDYGSISDGGVWMHSDFGSSLEQGLVELPYPEPLPGRDDPFPFVFVGDEAFPLKVYLMRPYSKPKRRLTMPQRIFNYRLSRARRVIENAFGILVSKWAILQGSITCKLETAESIVMAIICLHNFILESESDILPAQRMYQNVGLVDGDGPNGESLQNGAWRTQVHQGIMLQRLGRVGGNNPARAAITQRDKLRDYFLTEDGEVPWQYDYALRNAYGAQFHRLLNIPGENVNNVISARNFVGWYNGTEDKNLKINLDVEEAVVIGQ